MTDVKQLITEHLDIWLTAETEKKSGRGRSSGTSSSIYGVQKLRELILDLAIQGKLTSQNLNDRSAENLIEKFIHEKNQLIQKGEIKKEKKLGKIDSNELYFNYPNNWQVKRLGEVSIYITKGTTPTTFGHPYTENGVNFIKIESLENGYIDLNSVQFIAAETHELLKRSQLSAGDLLFSIAGTIGKIGLVREKDLPANTNQALAIIKGTNTVFDSAFLHLQLSSNIAHKTREKARGGAMNNISLNDISLLIVVIPPLEEQRRIVAKVDELMQLCDQLEQQQNLSTEAHEQLVDLLLNALTNSADADEFQQNWQRISANFDLLFTTDYSIEQLKQTILQLAVMGKLVKQDPTDEPASELLKQIAEEKAKLVKEGKIKKSKPLPEITDDEKPFELPDGWMFNRLNEVLDVRDGTHDSPKDYKGENFKYLVTSKNFEKTKINFETARKISQEDYMEIIKRSYVEEEDILFSMIGGNIGNQIMVTGFCDFAIKNVALFKYYLKEATYPYFIKLYTSYIALNLQDKALGGAQPFIGLGALRELIIGLPPINEQRRIVDKVNQLFSIIDQLRVLQAKARQTQLHLADVLVANAVEGA